MAKKQRSTRTSKKALARTGKGGRKSAKSIVPAARRTPHEHQLTPRETQSYRELFWQNVMREVLVSLMMASGKETSSDAKGSGDAKGASDAAGVLDGRLGIITHQGQRIPIARVFPVFAASMAQTPRELAMSVLLQCTVFQVHTPGGEVFTLPLHEIRGFHALTEELMAELEKSAGEGKGEEERQEPFGFAAFTSLSRGQMMPDSEEATADSGSQAAI